MLNEALTFQQIFCTFIQLFKIIINCHLKIVLFSEQNQSNKIILLQTFDNIVKVIKQKKQQTKINKITIRHLKKCKKKNQEMQSNQSKKLQQFSSLQHPNTQSSKRFDHSKKLQRLVIPPPSLNDQCISSKSLSSRKRKSTFITQNGKKFSPESLVMQSHYELVKYIDNLQNKVKNIIESHDSEFLLAYRNHLNRLKEQMEQIKNRNKQESSMNSNQHEKIQFLEKQIILFRQESLRLFDKLNEKDKAIQNLKMKIYQLQTESKFNKDTINTLMKRNKYLEALLKSNTIGSKTQLSSRVQQHQSIENKEKSAKKSLSFLEANTLRKYIAENKKRLTGNKKEPNSKMKWTGYSFYERCNANIQTRPTTTVINSKRNTLSTKKANQLRQMSHWMKNFQVN